jgi:hypothetical protein
LDSPGGAVHGGARAGAEQKRAEEWDGEIWSGLDSPTLARNYHIWERISQVSTFFLFEGKTFIHS